MFGRLAVTKQSMVLALLCLTGGTLSAQQAVGHDVADWLLAEQELLRR